MMQVSERSNVRTRRDGVQDIQRVIHKDRRLAIRRDKSAGNLIATPCVWLAILPSAARPQRKPGRKIDEDDVKEETSVCCDAFGGSLPLDGRMVRLDGVSREFDGARKVRALDNVTLHVAQGEILSVVGPSGSGKSTLLNLIGTLDRPTSGCIEIDGQDISSFGDAAITRLRREKIGFVFQFFNLLPSLTCLQNVGLPLHLRGWASSKVAQRAHTLL